MTDQEDPRPMAPDPSERIDRLSDELAIWRNDISRELSATRDQILDRIDAGYVRKDIQEQHLGRIDERITGLARKVTALQDSQTWVVRLVLAAVILAVLGLVLTHT